MFLINPMRHLLYARAFSNVVANSQLFFCSVFFQFECKIAWWISFHNQELERHNGIRLLFTPDDRQPEGKSIVVHFQFSGIQLNHAISLGMNTRYGKLSVKINTGGHSVLSHGNSHTQQTIQHALIPNDGALNTVRRKSIFHKISLCYRIRNRSRSMIHIRWCHCTGVQQNCCQKNRKKG